MVRTVRRGPVVQALTDFRIRLAFQNIVSYTRQKLQRRGGDEP